jgi:hypothetical protein
VRVFRATRAHNLLGIQRSVEGIIGMREITISCSILGCLVITVPFCTKLRNSSQSSVNIPGAPPEVTQRLVILTLPLADKPLITVQEHSIIQKWAPVGLINSRGDNVSQCLHLRWSSTALYGGGMPLHTSRYKSTSRGLYPISSCSASPKLTPPKPPSSLPGQILCSGCWVEFFDR